MAENDDYEALAHGLGHAFLAFLQTMAGANAPNVDVGDETQIPENKSPEEFTEKVFALAKELLSKKGKIDPTVFTFGRGKVRMFRLRNFTDKSHFSKIVSEIVRNTAPNAYSYINDAWVRKFDKPKPDTTKEDILKQYAELPPAEMDPNANEALIALYKDGTKTFQLMQFYHRLEEKDHDMIVFDETFDSRTEPEARIEGKAIPSLKDSQTGYIG